MTEDKTIKGNLYGVPVTATIKGKPDYTPTTEEVRTAGCTCGHCTLSCAAAAWLRPCCGACCND